jgi:hypothetical protein
LTNDVAHGPTSPNTPTPITTSDYTEGIASAYRTMLALASTESRIEQDQFVMPTDAWSQANAAYWSGGHTYSTTVNGRQISFDVTPPQSGPLAGRVFLLTYTGADDPLVLSGDLIFAGSVGRTDFPRGSWEDLLASIEEVADAR